MARFAYSLVLCGLAGFLSSTANAGITLNDWSIDLAGVTGAKTGTVDGIDVVNFNQAINHVTVNDTNGNGVADIGETAVVRGAIRASSFEFDSGGFPISNLNLNGTGGVGDPWEMTAVFQANVEFVTNPGGATGFGFVHTGGPDTFLNLYADEYTDALLPSEQASAFTGAGFDDGDLLAAFQDSVTGFVNTFSATALDGSDDAIFLFDALASAGATTGVLFDINGDDVVANALASPIVFPALHDLDTNENFDRDFSTALVNAWSGIPGQFGPSDWLSLFPTAVLPTDNTSLVNFFTVGDGDAVLTVVPEPASLAIWSLVGLTGAGARRYRRRKQS